ncbi:MAG: response regulator [Lachnospiraceae bacterium]|nr:response regulator [Lachnospiraceae bacterium]
MENTELQVWIKDMAGYDAGDIPVQVLPAFQILRDKMAQSERKIQALLRQKQLFTLLVNGTADMFVMFSAKDFKVEYVSPNIEYLLGLPLDEVRGDIQRLYDTAPDFEPPTREQLMAIPLGGSLQFLNEHIHQRKQEHRWYQKTFYHFFLNNDHKLMLVMSDRTTEMEMQRQLEISIEMTKSANEAKSSFLANMSHDIRTPMNAIVGFSSLLKREAENPAKVREYARKISSSSDHLLNLINDILDMSKIESGKTILHIEEFNLSELLEGIGIVVNPQAKAKNQEFRIRTKGITCDHLQGDKTRINQILMNLLSNAVKYTPEGGNIQLILSQEGQIDGRCANLKFQVIDNGMGMSPEYLEVIFDAFTREETAAVRGIQGTGLGMAITKNLVELMGGTISVQSEKGKGTEFTVNLKLEADAVDTDREFWEGYQIHKILVVDNNELICKDIKKVMSATGVIVAHTGDAQQAVQFVTGAAAVGQPYDLVVLDYKMPGITGVEIAHHIEDALGADAPDMVLFAYDWSEIEEEAMAAGISGFLPKPFFISNFRSLIRTMKGHESEEISENEISLSGLRFLAAEDNELNAEILQELLDIEGASCELAENGEMAVEMFRKSEPGYYDLILMDVQMPVMDGYTAAKMIRACDHADAKNIPIAAMTANAFEEDVRRALNAGMNAHIAKPVDMNLLKETVMELVRK